jgi:hypothetical protein
MRARILVVTLFGLSFAGCTHALRAQSTVCRPADDVSAGIIQSLSYSLLKTDSISIALRQSLNLPQLSSASQISLVTNEKTCQRAVSALNQAEGSSVSGRRVYLIQLGNSRYAVYDPTELAPGSSFLFVSYFDNHWTYLSTGGI